MTHIEFQIRRSKIKVKLLVFEKKNVFQYLKKIKHQVLVQCGLNGNICWMFRLQWRHIYYMYMCWMFRLKSYIYSISSYEYLVQWHKHVLPNHVNFHIYLSRLPPSLTCSHIIHSWYPNNQLKQKRISITL